MRKSRGFTLVELMVAIAIVAILVGIAAPSFRSMILSKNMASAVNSFLTDMRFARSEAIRRGGGVVMCQSASAETSTPSCDTNGWATGWIIFHDLDNSLTYTSNDALIKVQGPSNGVSSITGGATIYQFMGTGQLKLSAVQTIVFGSVPPFDSTGQRTVCVGLGGRARIAGDGTVSASDCN